MNKPLKYSLIGIAGLLFLVIAGALVFVLTFDANRYKPQIERLVQEKTGRTLKLQGPLEAAVWPSQQDLLHDEDDCAGFTHTSAAEDREMFVKLGAESVFLPLLSRGDDDDTQTRLWSSRALACVANESINSLFQYVVQSRWSSYLGKQSIR